MPATFVAVATGEAAGKLTERTPEIKAVLENHEELAETALAGNFAARVHWNKERAGNWSFENDLFIKHQ